MSGHFSRNRAFYINVAIGVLSAVIAGSFLALVLPMFRQAPSDQMMAMREVSVARSTDIVTALESVVDSAEELPKYWPLLTEIFESKSFSFFENVVLINQSKSSINLEFYSSVPGRLLVKEDTIDLVTDGAWPHKLAPGARLNATYFYQSDFVIGGDPYEESVLVVTADNQVVEFPSTSIRRNNVLAPLVRFLNFNELAGIFLVSTLLISIAVLAFDRSRTVNIDITGATLDTLNQLIVRLGAAREIVVRELTRSDDSNDLVRGDSENDQNAVSESQPPRTPDSTN